MDRTLLLLRHAEARGGGPDRDRPLTDEGREVARRRAADLPAVPEHVLCSTARRARQTLEALALPATVPVEVTEAVYEADANSLLLQLTTTPAAVRTLLVVGHNPTLSHLVAVLAAPPDWGGLAAGDLAVLRVAGDWADLGLSATVELAGVAR